FVLGILIGAGFWVSSYWKPSTPVAVQVADPAFAPSSPSPEAATTAAAGEGLDRAAGSPAESRESPSAEQKHEDLIESSREATREVSKESHTASALASKPTAPLVKRQDGLAGPGEPRDSQGVTGVQFVSDPLGARILVDDDESSACVAPCAVNLSPGRHTLMATLAGSATARRIFLVPADKVVTVVLQQSLGTLLVASSPPGAEVLIDGQNRGRTPANVRLPAGPHQLVVVLNGGLRDEQTVLVEGDRIVSRTIRW